MIEFPVQWHSPHCAEMQKESLQHCTQAVQSACFQHKTRMEAGVSQQILCNIQLCQTHLW